MATHQQNHQNSRGHHQIRGYSAGGAFAAVGGDRCCQCLLHTPGWLDHLNSSSSRLSIFIIVLIIMIAHPYDAHDGNDGVVIDVVSVSTTHLAG